MLNFVKKVAAVAIVALSLSACSVPAQENGGDGTLVPSSLEPRALPERTVLKVSSAGSFEFMTALYVAEAFGELEKENIAIEYVTLPSGDAIPALGLGQVDVSCVGIAATLFNAVADGADVRLVLPGPSSPNGDGLWVSTAYAEKPDKKGAIRIANSQGRAWLGIVPVKRYLDDIGLNLDDADFQTLPIADLATALELGSVDAAWLNSPAHLPFEERGTATRVASYEGSEVATGFAFGPRLLREEPEVGQAFIRALMRTVQTHLTTDYKSNPEIVNALAKSLGLSEAQIAGGAELDFAFEFEPTLQTAAQEIWIGFGDILSYDEPLAPDAYIDPRFTQSITVE
jgi:NitT/TauT family transport system substrate-binding protein